MFQSSTSRGRPAPRGPRLCGSLPSEALRRPRRSASSRLNPQITTVSFSCHVASARSFPSSFSSVTKVVWGKGSQLQAGSQVFALSCFRAPQKAGVGSRHGHRRADKPGQEARDEIAQFRFSSREGFADPQGEKTTLVKAGGAGRPFRGGSACGAGPGRTQLPRLPTAASLREGGTLVVATTSLCVPQRFPLHCAVPLSLHSFSVDLPLLIVRERVSRLVYE